MRNVIQWDLNSFFSKNTKIAQQLGALPPDPIAIGGWGLCPQTPVSDTFEYTSLLNTSSKLDFYIHFSTISFCPLPLPKSWQSAIRLWLQIFHSMISLANKKLLFRKFLMTSLHVICGLGPPQSKILATPMDETPICHRLGGSRGKAPSRRRHSAQKFCIFFRKNILILGPF